MHKPTFPKSLPPISRVLIGAGGGSRRKQQKAIEVEDWKKVLVERELRGKGSRWVYSEKEGE